MEWAKERFVLMGIMEGPILMARAFLMERAVLMSVVGCTT